MEQDDQLKGEKRKRGLDLAKGNIRLHGSCFKQIRYGWNYGIMEARFFFS